MIVKLKWDSDFFGRKIGKLIAVPAEKKLKQLIGKAREEKYAYLTCRLVVKKISEVQRLERHGFYMTDIGVVLGRKTGDIFEPGGLVREARAEDVPALKRIVRGLFRDSRFYNDPFFEYEEAERLYQSWIENSVLDKKTKIFLAEGSCYDSKPSGFITCKKVSAEEGAMPLVGVVPKKQGRGIGHGLVYAALNWFKNTGVDTVTVRTQANNARAMNFYAGIGFRIRHADMTMGLILNRS